MVQDDLWASLTEQAHIDGTLDRAVTVKDIMDTWTLQKGYPLVTVSRNGNQLSLTQRWFLLNPENTMQGTDEYKDYRWYIAFTFTTSQQLNWDTEANWFRPDQQECKLDLLFRLSLRLNETILFKYWSIYRLIRTLTRGISVT